MRSRFLRSLMLGCGLLLALPPGWCCTFAFRPAKPAPAQQEAPQDTPGCCPCCAKKAPRPAQTPTPAPEAPARCPCSDRQLAAPDAPKVFAADMGLVVPVPVTDLFTFWPCGRFNVALRCPAAHSSSHILNCVWLC